MDQKNAAQQPHVVRIIRIAASVMASLLLAIAILSLWRRHIGAFQTPLPVAMFLLVGLMIIGPAAALRHWWRYITRLQNLPPLEMVWTLCSPTVSILVIFASISVPDTSLFGIVPLGVFFLVCEMTVYRSRKQADVVKSPQPKVGSEIVSFHHLDAPLLSHTAEVEPQEDVSQELVRCRTKEGLDCLKGWLRVDIPAGRRAQSVHLAFCPAFQQPPKIEIQPEKNGPKNRIKTVQCLPYGAHLEVKLLHASPTEEKLTLRFQAVGE